MQVSCGNCQLSFDAPEGATGLVCPICRGPLLPKTADGAATSTNTKGAQDWSGGDLDDLIAILSGPALSARVEVLGATGDAAIGEVHLLAGGVSDALFGGKSTDDALDRLRAAKPTRFRVEQRLPNPTDGDLTYPGADAGTLESRALAHLMRYCEDYVITCSIEVWRGNENARVEYKRGEIGTVTVGGIDAPERLAEVMQWSSGNYRIVVQPLKLPAVAPKKPQAAAAAAAKVPVPAPAPSAQAARQASATKTIFGMPAAEIIKARAAAEAAKAASQSAPRTATPVPGVAPAPAASAAPPPAAAPVKTTPPGVAPNPVPAPTASASAAGSATKTIFGVPAPGAAGYTPVTQPSPTPTPAPARPAATAKAATPAPVVAAAAPAPAAAPAADDRSSKTGARKTAVPGPEVSAPADDPAATQQGYGSAPAAKEKEKEREQPKRPSTSIPTGAPKAVPAPAAAAATEKAHSPKRETPIWTYVGVGVIFGACLIGIYQLVGLLAH